MKFISEEEAKSEKEKLEDSMYHADDLKNIDLKTGLNWLNTDKSYNFLKSEAKEKMGSDRFFFLAHSRDTLQGKPQLIHQTIQTITLIKRINKKSSDDTGIDKFKMSTVNKFIDEPYDKRYDGALDANFSIDFWVYRVVSDDKKEYYVLSEKELPSGNCSITGMSINLNGISEFSKNMKVKSVSNLFIAKDFEPNIKIISNEEMVNLTKQNKITEDLWFEILGTHPFGNINNFQKEIQLLRSAFILSGKYTGYPLHLAIMGVAGTKKTMGHIETLSHKFDEDPNICEGANSRIKGLSPSFKEKPANIGYLAKADRVAWIDEIGKMVQSEMVKHQMQTSNILGDLNFLFEHKKRNVSSGNDNECTVQATAKFLIVTNPVGSKRTLHSHVGTIDPTMMSRVLWWVQDESEVSFSMSEGAISEIPPHTYTTYQEVEKKRGLNRLHMCWGGLENFKRDDFLTIFDSCYNSSSKIDKKEVQRLVDESVTISKEPMKSSVWKPRAFHHIYLLIDGLVKHRCLFKDYDSNFIAKQEDYDLAERLIIRMINSWQTDFSNKKW